MSKCNPFKFSQLSCIWVFVLLLNLWNTNFNIKSPIVFVFGFKHYKFLNTDILFILVFSFYNFCYKICSHEPSFILFPVFFRKLWHMVSMAQDTVMLDMCFKFPWRMLNFFPNSSFSFLLNCFDYSPNYWLLIIDYWLLIILQIFPFLFDM